MKVAIYARYSTAMQDKTSIAGQVVNCEALAAREGMTVVQTFQDEGISGNDDARPQYQAMLRRLTAGDFTGIVVDETSRITRNQAELHRLVAELSFRDQFMITGDGVDTRNESAELLLAVKAAVDAMEGRKIGYRTYRSLRERHKAGHCAGGRIFGYSTTQDGEYRKRIQNPEQVPIVLEIFERYANGESSKAIVRDFNERGIPSPGSYWKNVKRRSVGWSHTTLLGSYAKASGILRNPIYAGSVTWNKRIGKKVPGTGRRIQRRRPESEWIQYQDEALRIVSDNLFDRVQARLKTVRAGASPENKRGRPPRYLLTGLLVCDSCGGSYVVRNGRAYGCSSHRNGRDVFCEQHKTLKRSAVEDAFLSGVKEQLLAPAVMKEMTKRIRAAAGKPSDVSDSSGRLKALDRQINDLVETICEVGRSDVLTAKIKKLEADRDQILRQRKLPEISNALDFSPGATNQWKKIVSNLENLSRVAKPDEMESAREALRHIIGEVRIVEENDGVFAYPKINESAVYINGAQKRT